MYGRRSKFYKIAVRWIAVNDEPTDRDVDSIRDFISTQLVADTFGVEERVVAWDIAMYRTRSERTHRTGRGEAVTKKIEHLTINELREIIVMAVDIAATKGVVDLIVSGVRADAADRRVRIALAAVARNAVELVFDGEPFEDIITRVTK